MVNDLGYNMPMNTELIIHNIGYIVSSVLLISLSALVYFKDHKPRANKLMILALLSTAVFTISHVIGVNVSDPNISRSILMFNMVNIPLSIFFSHFVLELIGKAKEQKKSIIAIYTAGIFLLLLYAILPDTFLLPSVPQMYFPEYYVAGNLHWMMILFSNILVPVYFLFQMFRSYVSGDARTKNRLKFLFTGLFCGYAFGSTAIPLIYGIPVDPVWSIFFVPFFAIPFTFAVLKYDLLDIRIIAKRAFSYSIAVVLTGLLISLFDFSNNLIFARYPDFPHWTFPLASSVVVVSAGFFIWNKFRETDFLKYEFITIVTHKFRTPLTQIKWSAENLRVDATPDGKEESIQAIETANQQLVELTNLLVNLSDSDAASFSYDLKPLPVQSLMRDILADSAQHSAEKKISIIEGDAGQIRILADEQRIRSVFQVLIDNAISYTPAGGSIGIEYANDASNLTVKIHDTGIGIRKSELGHVFNKFFRGSEARKADTEGLGIGLFMARQMIERQSGKIWVESEGENAGSTFFVKLPLSIEAK